VELLNVKQQGFHGCHCPSGDRKDKVIITLTGSDGGMDGARRLARFYAARNIPALAVAYFKTRQTPKHLSEIPVDYIESAVQWLKTQGYTRVAIDGISKGAELALLASSLIPDITCVIARSPSYFVCEGLSKNYHLSNTSSWSWHGKPLPYTAFIERHAAIIKDLLRTREFSIVQHYRSLHVTDESIIPVENINGPVLLLSSTIDTAWPSSEYGEKLCERFEASGFQYPYRHESYDTVSHYLTPMDMWEAKLLFKVEREQPAACSQSRKAALAITLDWINTVWNQALAGG
jgi:dienelactone hydrolase